MLLPLGGFMSFFPLYSAFSIYSSMLIEGFVFFSAAALSLM